MVTRFSLLLEALPLNADFRMGDAFLPMVEALPSYSLWRASRFARGVVALLLLLRKVWVSGWNEPRLHF